MTILYGTTSDLPFRAQTQWPGLIHNGFFLNDQLLKWCEEWREKTEKHVSVKKKKSEKIIKPTAITVATTSQKGGYFHNDFRAK